MVVVASLHVGSRLASVAAAASDAWMWTVIDGLWLRQRDDVMLCCCSAFFFSAAPAAARAVSGRRLA